MSSLDQLFDRPENISDQLLIIFFVTKNGLKKDTEKGVKKYYFLGVKIRLKKVSLFRIRKDGLSTSCLVPFQIPRGNSVNREGPEMRWFERYKNIGNTYVHLVDKCTF